jgi:anaerobic magnesium-protoporphyrin IX monomethyl ester cyclase
VAHKTFYTATAMHVVLWNTRKLGAAKEFAGGFGVGPYPGRRGLRDWLIRRFFRTDRLPVPLLYAHLAAAFARLGHRVEYAEDRLPHGADLYVFCPSLMTLHLEQQTIGQLRQQNPAARVLVVGLLASVMPEAFDGLGVTVVKGEAEQLLWKLDDVLACPGAAVQLGLVEDLDRLPPPDWSPFRPGRFRVGYDFWRFPTALVQASRGCTFACNYCPYIILERGVRHRSPEAVIEEIRHGVRSWGFRSFKFRDPLFGTDAARLFRLADLLGRLPQPIQFSIETRVELMRPEVLRVLKRVGLTSITVGVETPDAATLGRYHRTSATDDQQRAFFDKCRQLGIRTVAGFTIGFPDDTQWSLRLVRRYAVALRPTFANFNVLTPYPGTEFFAQAKERIADLDFSRYTVYTPLLKYEHVTAEHVAAFHRKCFHRFYFRWAYLRENAGLLWPTLRRLGIGRPATAAPAAEPPHAGVPKPLSGAELLERKGLRQDTAHRHDGAADKTSDRRTGL